MFRGAKIKGSLKFAFAISQAEIWTKAASVAPTPFRSDKSIGVKQWPMGKDELLDSFPAVGIELGIKSQFFHVLGGLCHVYFSLIAFPKNNTGMK